MDNLVWFKDCSYQNKKLVGGKCSSLGELHKLSAELGFKIADGFCLTTQFYDAFISQNGLNNIIEKALSSVNTADINDVECTSYMLKKLISNGQFTSAQQTEIDECYIQLCEMYNKTNNNNLEVAIRSSAIAEDLPNASFAGQQDTYLNIKGIKSVEQHIKNCFASLFNTRAISYRKEHNIDISDVKISVAIQKMVRSDIGSAGVGFSLDPETGYNKAIIINSAFGLGELVVSGGIKPDEFIIDKRALTHENSDPIITKKQGDKKTKIIYNTSIDGTIEVDTDDYERNNFSLTNTQIIQLARFIAGLEVKYSTLHNKKMAIDIEWALDGNDKDIYVIQARPETIHNNDETMILKKYILQSTMTAPAQPIISGVAVGEKITVGKAKYMSNINEFKNFNRGDVLVTEMTTPDWEPIMKISSGIITNKGGRTCHAAIVSRELGINALVGTSNATEVLKNGQLVTISCAEGETGHVYDGKLEFTIEEMKLEKNISLPVKLMLNVGSPENTFGASLIPNSGVGLARIEFIINTYIKVHPLALYNYNSLNIELQKSIYRIIGNSGSQDPVNFFVENLARGVAKIASSFYPNDVIVRFSDFKTNEYKNLIGGSLYEPDEENPMIGWRGASRYYSEHYETAFSLECRAIKYVREVMKMDNVIVMIPFCRTPRECELVLETMRKYGLERGQNGLQVYLMCEIPSNVIEADLFSPLVDGVSIGGNDLLQLTLGIDRDGDRVTYLSDYNNTSYKRMIMSAIKTYKENGVKIGFCGQQPSDSISFCNFLIENHIDSISVTPDSALSVIKNLNTTTP